MRAVEHSPSRPAPLTPPVPVPKKHPCFCGRRATCLHLWWNSQYVPLLVSAGSGAKLNDSCSEDQPCGDPDLLCVIFPDSTNSFCSKCISFLLYFPLCVWSISVSRPTPKALMHVFVPAVTCIQETFSLDRCWHLEGNEPNRNSVTAPTDRNGVTNDYTHIGS